MKSTTEKIKEIAKFILKIEITIRYKISLFLCKLAFHNSFELMRYGIDKEYEDSMMYLSRESNSF